MSGRPATADYCPCPLAVPRAVAWHGPVPARLLFLSGAPRYHEEKDGVAFASPSFSWLEEALASAGLDPMGVHYATLTGCRPPHQRPLRAAEIEACMPRLDLSIAAVAPEVIVLCGPDVVAALLAGVTLTTGHGALVCRGRRRYYPIRHPYAALHSERYVEEVMSDLRRLAALLADGLPTLPAVTDALPPDAAALPMQRLTSGAAADDRLDEGAGPPRAAATATAALPATYPVASDIVEAAPATSAVAPAVQVAQATRARHDPAVAPLEAATTEGQPAQPEDDAPHDDDDDADDATQLSLF